MGLLNYLAVKGSKIISFTGGSLPGRAWDSFHSAKCSRIFLMTSGGFMKLMILLYGFATEFGPDVSPAGRPT
jgi:hypothetical protein